MKKSLVLLLAGALACTSCSTFSKTARQQRAYEKYVRRSSVARQKRQMFFRSDKPTMPNTPMPAEPSEPVQNVETGPQAVPTEG